MEQLEQKCHDLDVKIRRLEEERNTLMHDNEELVEELLKHAPESQRAEHAEDDRIQLKVDKVLKLSEDIGRVGLSLHQLSDSHVAVADRLRDIPELKLTIKVRTTKTPPPLSFSLPSPCFLIPRKESFYTQSALLFSSAL